MKGYNDDTFKPNNNITRAEFVTAICNLMEGSQIPESKSNIGEFKDVSDNHWALKYIRYGISKGLLLGYPDKTFRPSNNINYGEAITIMVKLLQKEKDTSNYIWPNEYLQNAKELQITKDIEFTPYKNLIRGDAAIMIDRIMFKLSKISSL